MLRNATDILLALLASKMRALVRLLKEQERGGKDGGADSNTDKDPDDEENFLIFVISTDSLHECVKNLLIVV